MWLITLAFVLGAPESWAQTGATRISAAVECPSCRISVDSLSTISGLSFESAPSTLRRDPFGNVFAIKDGVVSQFDKNGKPLRRIGRRGGGPGEYEQVRNILVDRDGTLHLLDAALARHTWYSPQGNFIASAPITVAGGIGLDAVLWGSRRVVVNVRARPGKTSPLLVANTDGSSSFLEDEVEDIQLRWLHRRLLVGRRNGELLVARPYAFELRTYSPNLKKLTTHLLPNKFSGAPAPRSEPSDGLFDKAFTPSVGGIWEDEASNIWILSILPHPDWKPVARPIGGKPLEEARMEELLRRPRIQLLVEVIDLKRLRLIARQQIDVAIGVPVGDGIFASSREDPFSEEPSLRFVQLRLERR